MSVIQFPTEERRLEVIKERVAKFDFDLSLLKSHYENKSLEYFKQREAEYKLDTDETIHF